MLWSAQERLHRLAQALLISIHLTVGHRPRTRLSPEFLASGDVGAGGYGASARTGDTHNQVVEEGGPRVRRQHQSPRPRRQRLAWRSFPARIPLMTSLPSLGLTSQPTILSLITCFGATRSRAPVSNPEILFDS